MGTLSGKTRTIANLLLVALFTAFIVSASIARADDDSGDDGSGDTDFARSAIVKILF